MHCYRLVCNHDLQGHEHGVHPRLLSVDTSDGVGGASELYDDGVPSASERATVSASVQTQLTPRANSFAFAVGIRDGCVSIVHPQLHGTQCCYVRESQYTTRMRFPPHDGDDGSGGGVTAGDGARGWSMTGR